MKLSIFNKLQILHILTLLSVIGAVFIVSYIFLNTYFFNFQKKYLEHVGHGVPSEVSSKINMYKKNLERAMEDNLLKSYNKNFSDALLVRFLEEKKNSFASLSYVDEKGNVLFSLKDNRVVTSTKSIATNKIFNTAMNHPNSVHISDVIFDKELNAYTIQMAISKVTYFGEAFQGLIFSTITLSQLLDNEHLFEDTELNYRIINKQAKILFSAKKSEENGFIYLKSPMLLNEIEKTLHLSDEDFRKVVLNNTETFTYFSHIIDKEYMLLISYNYDDFYQMHYGIIKILSLVFVILIIISSMTTYKYTTTITRPLQRLFDAIQEVSKGNLDHSLSTSSKDSLYRITKSFNLMIKQLKKYRNLIETKSKNLEDLNNNLEEEVTKQIKLSKQKDKLLYQQAKLASMGEMIDAVAHQWRQPLNAILSQSSGFKLKIEHQIPMNEEEMLECSNKIAEQVEHLNNTMQTFRSFMRPDFKLEYSSLHEIVETAGFIIKDELQKQKILVDNAIPRDIKVYLVKNEMIHVLINLMNNSRDAFNEKEIEKRNITIKAKLFSDKINITITDNAGGMPKDVLAKIFDANFTTKSNEFGTGIGLYMSKQIIEKINAKITAEVVDENGNKVGTRFIITFPVLNNDIVK